MSIPQYISIPSPSIIAGSVVSAIVYTTITTTGDAAAIVAQTGIDLTGNIIASGTDIMIGTLAGNTVRTLSKTLAITGPAISASSRLGAAGLSVLAGATTVFATSLLIYSGKYIGSFINKTESKQPYDEIVTTISDDDDVQIIDTIKQDL
jgi:hypothetical protein